jgi:hypothetical protein
VNAETIAVERFPAEPDGLTLDLGAIELEPLPVPTESAADAMDVLPLPESLSLDELLGVEPEVTPAALPASPSEPVIPGTEPVFELAEMDAPPLPMVEAGTGEPPALSVEDLLGSGVGAPASADTLTLDLPELDLTALSEVPSPAPADDTSVGPPFAETVTEPSEVLVSDPLAEQVPGPEKEEVLAEVPSDVALAADVVRSEAGPLPLDAAAPEIRQVDVEEAGLAAAEVAPAAAAAATGQQFAEVVAPHEMAAMREAVTARVAEELRHELSEKLLDRFEKIVWEVVPDLAEILITKEIERIRRLAEEERKS